MRSRPRSVRSVSGSTLASNRSSLFPAEPLRERRFLTFDRHLGTTEPDPTDGPPRSDRPRRARPRNGRARRRCRQRLPATAVLFDEVASPISLAFLTRFTLQSLTDGYCGRTDLQ